MGRYQSTSCIKTQCKTRPKVTGSMSIFMGDLVRWQSNLEYLMLDGGSNLDESNFCILLQIKEHRADTSSTSGLVWPLGGRGGYRPRAVAIYRTQLGMSVASLIYQINQLINRSINQSIDQSINQSINQSIIWSNNWNKVINPINQSVNRSINRSINQSMTLKVRQISS